MNNIDNKHKIAIIDYGMGNLFSVKHACSAVGLVPVITKDKKEILSSDAIILPGVGSFKTAMKILKKLDIIAVIRDLVGSDKPILGICLGAQLFLSQSYEFGLTDGINIIEGEVLPFENVLFKERKLKIPHISWNNIYRKDSDDKDFFADDSLLGGVRNNEFMYFVHSFYIKPKDINTVLALSKYGSCEFCSVVRYKNIFACQFHPERSGVKGLRIYENLANLLIAKGMWGEK